MDERQALSENTRRDLLSPGVSEIMGELKRRKARNPTPKVCGGPGGQWDDLSVDFSQSVTTNMDELGVNCSNVGNMESLPLYAVVEEYLASNRLRSLIEGPDDEDESDEDNEFDSSHGGSSFSLDDGSSTSGGILDSIYTPTPTGRGRRMNRIIEKLNTPAAKREELVNDEKTRDLHSPKVEAIAENSGVKSGSGLNKRRWHSMFAKTRAKVKSDLEKNAALGADESKLTAAIAEKSAQTPLEKHLDSMFGLISSHATDDITLNTLRPETSEEDVKDFIRPLILEEETEIVFDEVDDDDNNSTDDKLWGNPKIWNKPAAESRFNSIKKRSGSLANALKAGRERRSTDRGPKVEACSIPAPTKHESVMDILMASGDAVVVGSPKNVRLDTLEKRQRSILELLSLPSEESGSQLDSSSANKEYQKLKVKLRSIREILSSPQGSGSLDPRSKMPSVPNDAPVEDEPRTKVAPPQSSGSRKERTDPSLQSKDSEIRAVAIEETNILGSLAAAAKKRTQESANVSETCGIESTTRPVLPVNSAKAKSEIDRRPKQNMTHARPKGLRARLSKRKGGTTLQSEESPSSHVQISCGTGIEVESALPTSSAGEALLTESKDYKPSGPISSIDVRRVCHNDSSKTIRRKKDPKKTSNVVVAHCVRQSDSNSKSIKVEAAGSMGIELAAHEGRGNATKQKSQHKLSSSARMMMAPTDRKPGALKLELQKPQRPIASNHRSDKLRADPALSIERQNDFRVRTIATPNRNPDTLELELSDPGRPVASKYHSVSASKRRNDSSVSIEKQGDLRVRAIAPSDSNPDTLELELGGPRHPMVSSPRSAVASKSRVGSVRKKEEARELSKNAVSTAEQSKEVVSIASEKSTNTAITRRGIIEEPDNSTATPMQSLKPAIKSSGNNRINPGMKVHFATSIAGKEENAAPTASAGGRNSKSGQTTKLKRPKRRPLTPAPLDSTADATFVEKAMQQMNLLGGQSETEKQESSSGKAPLSIYRFLDFNPCHSALVDSPKTKQLSSGVEISGLCSADNTESNIGRSVTEPIRDAREDQAATKEMCTNRDSAQEVQFSPTKNNVSHLLQCNADASFVEKTVQQMNSLQSETDSDSGIADLRDENSPDVSRNRFFDFGQCGESLAVEPTHKGKTGTGGSHTSKSQLTREMIDCSTDTRAANGPEINISLDIAAQTGSQARVVPTFHNDTLFCSTGGSTLKQAPKDSNYPERVQSGGVLSAPWPKKTPLSDNRSSTPGPLKLSASSNPNHGKEEEDVQEQSIEYRYSMDTVLDPERRRGQIVGDTSSETQRDNRSTPSSIIGKMKLALQKKRKSTPSSKEAVSLPSETSESREIQDPAPSIASSAVTSIEKLSMIRAEYEKALAEVTGGDSMPGAPESVLDEKSGASSIRLSEIRADFKRARKYLDRKESVSERALSAAEKEVARRLANDLMILSKIERKRTKIRQRGAEGKVKVLEKTLELVESIKNRRSNEEESYCLDDSSSDNIDNESHPETPNTLFTLLASDSETTAAETPTTQYSVAGVFDWLLVPEGKAK